MKETEEQEQEHISSAAGILVFHIFLEKKNLGFCEFSMVFMFSDN